MDYISCTGFVRLMGYKSLLLDANSANYILVCRRGGVGGGCNDDNHHHHGTNIKEEGCMG